MSRNFTTSFSALAACWRIDGVSGGFLLNYSAYGGHVPVLLHPSSPTNLCTPSSWKHNVSSSGEIHENVLWPNPQIHIAFPSDWTQNHRVNEDVCGLHFINHHLLDLNGKELGAEHERGVEVSRHCCCSSPLSGFQLISVIFASYYLLRV